MQIHTLLMKLAGETHKMSNFKRKYIGGTEVENQRGTIYLLFSLSLGFFDLQKDRKMDRGRSREAHSSVAPAQR